MVMLRRQTARVTANKPWGGNVVVEERNFHCSQLTITFIVKLLVYSLVGDE